ncbi:MULTISPECIES: helix-turn-helix domain-containing protein [unclassified Mesorhizobium]|uniref:helix-turn-helix domain-containing protein n=1 Tax=unclassified Mesorhizobium TaxID=325217 RepID=UPI000FE6F827|nr:MULTISPECIES: helix-turn-helix domain-containing protein [unclassified Mesorhizobium]RWC21895.1 MAG: helix-turn-helix domain-containing protein [Mesorhizobium sp.]RWD75783.1 MAG: helix-turn-helix domain-containing protein [Mesorhizobium sp.]RWE52045.1 MAG: helix-turn-helix domain-containing protein [Mesorhizobium sp.]RWE92264.1 MAG: helix-turn-helix domain-containing protein [Mesorhizobium sp.]RWF51287.1 MAG: helix-turn-helix domain-containing protein [Mesorhizobium sp.]
MDKLGGARAAFHRWYDRFLSGGVDALKDRPPQGRVWNCIPEDVRERWQTDFLLEGDRRGWFYLWTILGDFSATSSPGSSARPWGRKSLTR